MTKLLLLEPHLQEVTAIASIGVCTFEHTVTLELCYRLVYQAMRFYCPTKTWYKGM